jgi:flagellar hook-associated protein 3 FlgL
MRITEGMRYQNLLQDIARGQERILKAQQQVSSGKKISIPSDDPTATADILRLHGEQNEGSQYQRNLTFAKSKLQVADATLDNIQQIVERARSLGQLSFGNPDLATGYVAEINSLRDQLISDANTAHAGRYIFGGSVTTSQPYVKNPDSSVTYNGNSDEMPLQINRSTAVQTQIPGSELFSGPVDIFQAMSDLATAMQSGDKDGIDAQLKNLTAFSDTAGAVQTKVGGYLNLATDVENSLSSAGLARNTELSKEEAADLATAISEFTMSQNGLQATLAIGARMSQLTILDYLK